MNCVFCKIINGDIPSYTIYEDDLIKVILDIKPDAIGHTLLIPKRHIINMDELNKEELNDLINVSALIKERIATRLNSTGFTHIINEGSPQEVKHFHMHIKPHYLDKKVLDIKEVYEILK